MSRIYDALKRAQSERAAGEKSEVKPEFERRRTDRIEKRVRVFVYGHGLRHQPFHEETTSLVVNSHGGVLVLSNTVKSGQELLLMNPNTWQEQSCHVVHLVKKQRRHNEVAVAFSEPAPAFWGAPEGPAPDASSAT